MGILFQHSALGTPPTIAQVRLRLRLLQVICLRGYQEMFTESGIPVATDDDGLVLLPDWIYAVADALEQWEIQCLNLPLGQLPAGLLNRATWQCEGIAVLLWALQLRERPSFEAAATPMQVLKEIDAAALDAAALLPMATLQAYAENLHAWQSRFQSFWAHPIAIDFVAQAEQYGQAIDQLPLVGQDLGLMGATILENREIVFADDFRAIATERLRAAKWLCGLSSAWFGEIDA